jgi:hypothetical protein
VFFSRRLGRGASAGRRASHTYTGPPPPLAGLGDRDVGGDCVGGGAGQDVEEHGGFFFASRRVVVIISRLELNDFARRCGLGRRRGARDAVVSQRGLWLARRDAAPGAGWTKTCDPDAGRRTNRRIRHEGVDAADADRHGVPAVFG